MSIRRRIAQLAVTATAVAAPLVPIAATQAHAAGCEWPTRQYVVTAQTLSLKSEPDGYGYVKAVLHQGDLFNSSYVNDSWIGGNAYTGGSKAYIGNGFVLRGYLAYNGNSWC